MANVTIPNLTSATTIAPSTDLMVLEQTEGTRKATLSQIFTSSATSGSGLGITSGGVYTIKSGLDSDISDINTLLGSTSIASIGDGTVTGAVSKINSDLSDKQNKITTIEISVATQLTFNSDIQCGIGTHDLSLSPGYPNPSNIIGCEVISSNISTYSTDLVEAYILNDKKTLRLCHRGSINSTGVANTRVRFYVSA